MERGRNGKLPWAIVLLIIVLACAIAWCGAWVYTRTLGSGAFTNYQLVQLDAVEKVEAISDGFVYYNGSSVTKKGADASTKWSYSMGTGADFRASDAGVAAWIDRSLTLIDGESGATTYSGAMDEEILSAQVGGTYTAVLLGPEHNSTIVLMENGGRRVDSITLAGQTVIDYGFFYNDTLFWVMTLDTNGTVPACTISTYRPGRRIVGSITDGEQILYHVMFQSSRILCAGDTYLKTYDYNGTETESERKLVYGWTLADVDDSADNPMMAFVPNGQYDGNAQMHDVRMIRGGVEQTVRMPFGCTSLTAEGDRVYGFSSSGYVMVAQMGQQKVCAYNVGVPFEEVVGVASGNVAILKDGNLISLVSLQ